MKKRLLAPLLLITAVILSACASLKPVSAQAQAAPAPEPTESIMAVPVTPDDFPFSYFPKLGVSGAIPQKAYHIGVVIEKTSPYAPNLAAFEELGKKYEESFGMTVTIERPDDAAQSVRRMIADGIELLIYAPGEDENQIGAICEDCGVPYITIGRRTEARPGEGRYVLSIEPDLFYSGILAGQHIADTMKARYGEPFGNIAEITGVVSDEASILRSGGLRHALAPYDRINVVCSVAGSDDADTIYKAAENIFKAYREGELDGIVVPDDGAALTVLQAALDYDRNDVAGSIWSTGATAEGLTGVYYGQFAQTVETWSQTGLAAMEYAVRYLNGGTGFPPAVTALMRSFTAETQEKKDGIKELIAALKERNAQSCLESEGAYAAYLPDTSRFNYPQRYDLYTDPAKYLSAYAPYTTEKAIYMQKQSAQAAEASQTSAQ